MAIGQGSTLEQLDDVEQLAAQMGASYRSHSRPNLGQAMSIALHAPAALVDVVATTR